MFSSCSLRFFIILTKYKIGFAENCQLRRTFYHFNKVYTRLYGQLSDKTQTWENIRFHFILSQDFIFLVSIMANNKRRKVDKENRVFKEEFIFILNQKTNLPQCLKCNF